MAAEFYLSRFAEANSQAVVLMNITSLTLFLYLLSQVFWIKRIGKIPTCFSQSFQMLFFKQQLFLADFPSCNQLETCLFTIEYSRLLMNLSVFRFPSTIPSNATTHSIDGFPLIQLNGTNGDIENPSSIWKQETNRSTVDSTRLWFQLLNNFHSRYLRSSCDGSTRKERAKNGNQVNIWSQPTLDGRSHLPNS